jgi:hypothetical protein
MEWIIKPARRIVMVSGGGMSNFQVPLIVLPIHLCRMDYSRPQIAFERQGLMRRAVPFAMAACLAFALVPLPPSRENPVALGAAAAITLLIIGSAVLVPWQRMPKDAHVGKPPDR